MSVATTRPSPPTTRGSAARAVDAVKIYGSGPTEVRALDGITVEFERAASPRSWARRAPGKSTLLHCLAGLDALTSGTVFIGDTDLTTLNDKQLTLLRRDRIGFVFQAFNLVPTLTAEENITLPLALAGRKPDQEWLRHAGRPRSASPTGSATGRRSCPAASSSASPPPGRWSPGPS